MEGALVPHSGGPTKTERLTFEGSFEILPQRGEPAARVQHTTAGDKLYVITPITNPQRYARRYQLFNEYKERMLLNPLVQLVVVEGAFGDRPHVVTEPGRRWDVQVRTSQELWHKENLINIGVQHLPAEWKYVAWIDGDLTFANPRWAEETIHELQHRPVVQLFQTAVDLGPDGRSIQVHNGFAWQYASGAKRGKGYTGWHPGFSWGCTRAAWEAMGGLVDYAILGSADHHMATAFIGDVASSYPTELASGYGAMLHAYEQRCVRAFGKRIGYVRGTVLHHWHGKKANRRYIERWQILKDSAFNPITDLRRDWQGVYSLTDTKPELAEQISRYFRQRNEDGLDE